jgi:hypothetical protein
VCVCVCVCVCVREREREKADYGCGSLYNNRVMDGGKIGGVVNYC